MTTHLIGAFVFPDAWSDLARFRERLTALRDFGVNAIMTETASYDAAAIEAVHDEGLAFHAGVACFSDHASNFAEIRARPELWPVLESGDRRAQMEWYLGLTPTDRHHQTEVLTLIEAIATTYHIDGLFLDFVRWPVHWELEFRPGRSRPPDSSFDAATVALFAKSAGLAIPRELDTAAAQAAFIHKNYAGAWADFKCKVVTDFVADARAALKASRASAEFGAYVVPDIEGMAERLTGQRLADLTPIVDRISPMLYHNILLHPPAWVGEELARVTSVAGSKTLPVIQADFNRGPASAGDWGPPMSLDNWQAVLAEVERRPDLSGLIVFPGTSLLGDGRGGALRSMVSGWR